MKAAVDANQRGEKHRGAVALAGLAAAMLVAVGWGLSKVLVVSAPGENARGTADQTLNEPAPGAVRFAAASAVPVPMTSAQGQDRQAGARASATYLTDWSRYPSGLMAALDQAIRNEDGLAAYELVRILQRCERLPQELERTRQQLSDLQATGILKQQDRRFMDLLLPAMQRDHSHCQELTGDLRHQRRQLLEVAVRQGVDGAGMTLLSDGVREPWVMRQVLREAEDGDDAALAVLALGEIAQASRLQRDAAGDALLRSASEPAASPPEKRRLQRWLDEIARQRVMQAWQLDTGNPAKSEAAKAAYLGEGVHPLQRSTDARVLALADQYFTALKKRKLAQGS